MDGVFRNFGKDGAKVWSYRTLNPEEIKEVVNLFPEDKRKVSSKINSRALMDGTSRT